MTRLNSLSLVMVAGLAGLLAAGEATANAISATKTVKCDNGQTITKALETSNPNKPLIVQVIGTCHENVTVKRSDTTLSGIDPSSSVILGVPETDPIKESPITIRGATDVIVENLTVANGGSSGIVVVTSSATIRSSVVEANAQTLPGSTGIIVGAGSFARIDDVIVRQNPYGGIRGERGGSMVIINSEIQENLDFGIQLRDGANARIGIDRIGILGPNTIENNGGNGIILLRSSSALIYNNTIAGNGRSGINISQGSSAFLRENNIHDSDTYEVVVADGGSARLQGNTLTDDSPNTGVGAPMEVVRGSNAHLVGDNTLLQQNPSSTAVALEVFHVSSFRQDTGSDDVLTGPIAVSVGNFSSVDLRQDFTVNGDVGVFEFGTFRVRGTGTINGDISALGLATATEQAGSNVTLNGTCTGNCSGF